MDLPLADQVPDRGRCDKDLAGHHAPLSVSRLQELLGDDPLEGCRQLHPDLLLLVRWEHVDDPVDRLWRVLRMERREHEVSGLRGGYRRRDRL